MDLTKFSRFIVLIIFTQCMTVALGQGQGKTPHPRESELPTVTPRMDIYQILDHARQLSDEARGLEPKENEIRLQAGLADAVWAIDKMQAKRFLLRGFDLTLTVLAEQSRTTKSKQSPTDAELLFRQINSIAARYDPQLEKQITERWQNNLRSTPGKDGESKADPAQLSSLLLNQSSRLLKEEAPRAGQLFRESVSLRVLPEHYYFLLTQRARDAVTSDILFRDALRILAQRPIAEANELLILSSYLFSPNNSISYVAIDGYNTANAAGNVSAVPKNTDLAKQYLLLLLAKLNPSESIPAGVAYFALKNLTNQYGLVAPELLQDFYAKLGSIGPRVSESERRFYKGLNDDFETSEADANANWEKRIEIADQMENVNRRDLEYFTIIVGHLLRKEHFTQAAELAAQIDNNELRQTLLDFVSLRSIQAGLKKLGPDSPPVGDRGKKIGAKMKVPILKSIALASIAHAQIEQRFFGDAIRVLDQAHQEAERISDDQDRLQVQLMLTQLFLRADANRGFDAAVQVFKGINKFPDFDFRRSIVLLRATVYGFNNKLPIELPAQPSLASTVRKMCNVNCPQTFESCGVLERKEVRLRGMFEAIRTAILDDRSGPKSRHPAKVMLRSN